MSLDIIRGAVSNHRATESLINNLERLNIVGTLYTGYPIMATADSSHTVEALLVSVDVGLVAFYFASSAEEVSEIKEVQDQIYYVIESSLSRHDALRRGRTLAVQPNIVAIFPDSETLPATEPDYFYANRSNLADILEACVSVDAIYFKQLSAAIQRVTSIKPSKRRDNVTDEQSKGGILKKVEREIANLDRWQKAAAIESPDGPQRIRGLAGSGKTVVLALKAAYLHTRHPDWHIAVTFHTRSLYQQFEDLIERFVMEHSNDRPDWTKLRILHSWGSLNEPGIYSEIYRTIGGTPKNFLAARSKYGSDGAFEGVCNEALIETKASSEWDSKFLFDAILIDEAQDLPQPFFELVYEFTKPPKRIVWAYDELQNLSETKMPKLSELFGLDSEGNPKVEFSGEPNKPRQDIVLPICYRNTPWSLTIAHALGFGIYRSELVQFFDDLNLWKEIGYEVSEGDLEYDTDVSLQRGQSSTPSFFRELLTPEDSFDSIVFNTKIEQYVWMADEIKNLIQDQQLDPDDILVILPNARTAKTEFKELESFINKRGINCHLAGVTTSRDTFSEVNSVTVSSIYRAKGNESAVVFVSNAQFCHSGMDIQRLRNILFTAITRSRCWVYVTGYGDRMEMLDREIKGVIEKGYVLSFHVPTQDKIKNLRLIHRDREEAVGVVDEAMPMLGKMLDLFKSGEIGIDEVPELEKMLKEFFKTKQ